MNIVTRSTYSPSTQERLAAWFQRSANIRAAASLGCETSMQRAPNVIPIRPRQTRVETLAECAIAYCRPRGYAPWIEREFVDLAMYRIRHGASMASAIQSAKVRADFCHQHGKGPTSPEAA